MFGALGGRFPVSLRVGHALTPSDGRLEFVKLRFGPIDILYRITLVVVCFHLTNRLGWPEVRMLSLFVFSGLHPLAPGPLLVPCS